MQRCRDLASPEELPQWTHRIFTTLVSGLCTDHIEYGLLLANEALPTRKNKAWPTTAYFQVVKDANSVFYLLQKHFANNVLPAVRLGIFYFLLISRSLCWPLFFGPSGFLVSRFHFS